MESALPEPRPVVADMAEDDAWALPRPKASTRQKVLAAVLGAACLSLTSFAVGVGVGKNRVPAAGVGFGRGGFGNPGAGGLQNAGVTAAPSGVVSTTTTTADPNLGGLLPGLEIAPETSANTPTVIPTSTAPSGS